MREKEQVSFGGLVVVWLVFFVSRWLFGRFVRVPSVVRFGFGRSVGRWSLSVEWWRRSEPKERDSRFLNLNRSIFP